MKKHNPMSPALRTTLFALLIAGTATACGSRETPAPAAAEPATAPQPAPSTEVRIEGADFVLEEQPPLEKTVELDALPEEQQKAIYLELKAAMEETSNRVLMSGKSADEAYEVMDRVQNKAKYELGKKHGLTIEQLDQLNVYGLRFGW